MIPEYVLLIAISWFYLAEHVRLGNDGVVALSIRRGEVVGLNLPPINFTILNRIIYIVLPFNLFEMCVITNFDIKSKPVKNREISRILLYSKIMKPLMWLEVLSVIFYTFIVPILIFTLPAYKMAITVIIVHFILWTTTTMSIYAIMRRSAFRKRCRICIAFEMLISPGLMAAIRRRLESYIDPKGDIVLCEYEFLNANKAIKFCNSLEIRMLDLVDYQELSELEAISYIRSVRSIHVRD